MNENTLTFADINSAPEIVRQAWDSGVTDLGQLSPQDHRDLAKAVRRGLLTKIKSNLWTGAIYPLLKTVYVCPRAEYIRRLTGTFTKEQAEILAGAFYASPVIDGDTANHIVITPKENQEDQ